MALSTRRSTVDPADEPRNEDLIMTEKQPTPNDDRAKVKNPNNPAHKDDRDNHAGQLDSKNPKHQPAPSPAAPAPVKKP